MKKVTVAAVCFAAVCFMSVQADEFIDIEESDHAIADRETASVSGKLNAAPETNGKAGKIAYSAEKIRVPVHSCDEVAGDPFDPVIRELEVDGVPWDTLFAKETISACLAAVKAYPDEPRFQYELARLYRKNKQYIKAAEHYRIAADAGYAAALAGWGDALAKGWGVPADRKKALEYWRKAAEAGIPSAMFSLAMYYYEKGSYYKKALSWFKKAAEKEHPDAMYMLGHMYSVGEGSRKDESQAISWYKKAADYGQPNACDEMSYYYLYGAKGLRPDPEKAADYFLQAIENGNGVQYGEIPENMEKTFWSEVQRLLKEYYQIYSGPISGRDDTKTQKALSELSKSAEEKRADAMKLPW